MIDQQLFLERDVADSELTDAVARLLNVDAGSVFLFADWSEMPAAPAGAQVLCERRRLPGDFPLRIELYPQRQELVDSLRVLGRRETTRRFCEDLRTRCLAPDDATDNPDAFVLIASGKPDMCVHVDSERFDERGEIALAHQELPARA